MLNARHHAALRPSSNQRTTSDFLNRTYFPTRWQGNGRFVRLRVNSLIWSTESSSKNLRTSSGAQTSSTAGNADKADEISTTGVTTAGTNETFFRKAIDKPNRTQFCAVIGFQLVSGFLSEAISDLVGFPQPIPVVVLCRYLYIPALGVW